MYCCYGLLLCVVAMGCCYAVQDVCSLECKARHLRQLGRPDPPALSAGGGGWMGEEGEGEVGGWRYVEHSEVGSWSEKVLEKLRNEVCPPFYLSLSSVCLCLSVCCGLSV